MAKKYALNVVAINFALCHFVVIILQRAILQCPFSAQRFQNQGVTLLKFTYLLGLIYPDSNPVEENYEFDCVRPLNN